MSSLIRTCCWFWWKGGGEAGSLNSCAGLHQTFCFPEAQRLLISTKGPQEIRFHPRAPHLQHFIHADVYSIDPSGGNGFSWGLWGYGCSAGGSQVHTTQRSGRICLTVFSSWKNCPLPLIFRVKSRWRHSKQAVFCLPQQCFLAAPLRIWTLMRSTKTSHPGLTCGFIQTEWYPRGTLIKCSNRLYRFQGDTEGAFLLLSFNRMADLHPQPQGKAQTPYGGNECRLITSGHPWYPSCFHVISKPLTYLLNYIHGTSVPVFLIVLSYPHPNSSWPSADQPGPARSFFLFKGHFWGNFAYYRHCMN